MMMIFTGDSNLDFSESRLFYTVSNLRLRGGFVAAFITVVPNVYKVKSVRIHPILTQSQQGFRSYSTVV